MAVKPAVVVRVRTVEQLGERTSALDQKAYIRATKVMSALPPKADMCGANGDVRFGPIADIRWANADSASNQSRFI